MATNKRGDWRRNRVVHAGDPSLHLNGRRLKSGRRLFHLKGLLAVGD